MKAEDFHGFLANFNSDSANQITMAPNFQDLYNLYFKARINRSVAILEIGSGWSTLALSLALIENEISFSHETSFRHPNLFTLMTVDASSYFQDIACARLERIVEFIPHKNNIKVIPIKSDAQMTLLNNQICHTFLNIPPFTADFIYLDGPDCAQVQGDYMGMHVRFGNKLNNNLYGLPMSGDLLMLEPYMWPGTIIVIDGRGANARFLQNNFKRNWEYSYDSDSDQHYLLLNEKPWGGISSSILEFNGRLSKQM